MDLLEKQYSKHHKIATSVVHLICYMCGRSRSTGLTKVPINYIPLLFLSKYKLPYTISDGYFITQEDVLDFDLGDINKTVLGIIISHINNYLDPERFDVILKISEGLGCSVDMSQGRVYDSDVARVTYANQIMLEGEPKALDFGF